MTKASALNIWVNRKRVCIHCLCETGSCESKKEHGKTITIINTSTCGNLVTWTTAPVHKVSEFYKYMSSYFVTFVTHSYLCQQKVKILIDYIICNICWLNLILGRVWFLLTFEFLTLAEFMESFIFSKNKQICEILATVQKKRPKEIQKRFKQNWMAEVIWLNLAGYYEALHNHEPRTK